MAFRVPPPSAVRSEPRRNEAHGVQDHRREPGVEQRHGGLSRAGHRGRTTTRCRRARALLLNSSRGARRTRQPRGLWQTVQMNGRKAVGSRAGAVVPSIYSSARTELAKAADLWSILKDPSFGTGRGTRIADIASDTPQIWGSPRGDDDRNGPARQS